MSALMLGAMTLIGRETDRLIHILVSDPFDNYALSPRFYFPSSTRHGVPGRATIYTGKQAQLELSDIPFVPLRNQFDHLGESPGTYSKLVEKYRKNLKKAPPAPVKIRLNEIESSVEIDDKTSIKLNAREFLLFSFLIRSSEEDWPLTCWKDAADFFPNFLKQIHLSPGAEKIAMTKSKFNQ